LCNFYSFNCVLYGICGEINKLKIEIKSLKTLKLT